MVVCREIDLFESTGQQLAKATFKAYLPRERAGGMPRGYVDD